MYKYKCAGVFALPKKLYLLYSKYSNSVQLQKTLLPPLPVKIGVRAQHINMKTCSQKTVT